MSAQDRIRSIRLSLRFIAPLVVTLALLAYALVPLVDRLTLRWWVNDLDIRSQLIANTMEEQLADLVEQGVSSKVNALFTRALQDERLYALAFCDESGKQRYQTATYPSSLGCKPPVGTEEEHSVVRLKQGPLHVVQHPIYQGNDRIGSLILVHDMSFVERRSADTRRYLIGLFVVLGVVISLVTVFIAHLSWRGWVAGVRALLRGEGIVQPFAQPASDDLHPLASDLRAMLRDLDLSRRNPDRSATWSPEMLRGVLREKLLGDEILVVSNREPFLHVHTDEGIKLQRPASGLVTAMEPVMRACSGTWIAHGSGSADRDTADEHGRLRVPPEKPSYTLRRVWLTREEEQGYYYGFANEGLWPLCHIAHTRPIFRASDWQSYLEVNQKFADAVVEEIADSLRPVILVQDYHFALLPRLIKMQRPDARVAIFWHIPWPNPEAFGICPWRRELLEGLLGADLIGFHTQSHCNNFLETVDRTLESRIDWEHFSASRLDHHTMVRPFPISVDLVNGQPESDSDSSYADRSALLKSLGIEATFLGVGVDRIDYTKGILERFLAIERFLEKWPMFRSQFTFVQIGAPSRTHIKRYHDFLGEVELEAERINWRFQTGKWKPIVFLK